MLRILFAGLVGTDGIQGSCHTWVSLPDPIVRRRPERRSGLAAIILLYPKEVRLAFPICIGSLYLKYLPFNTRLRRGFGNLIRRHNCFANKARLNSSHVPNSRPPSEKGVQSLSQAIQWISLLSFLVFHQQIAIALLSFERLPLGRRKHDITYVGRVCATELIRTSLPPLDKNFHVHPFILFWSVSLTKEKTWVFEPWISSGSPKQDPIPRFLNIRRDSLMVFRIELFTSWPNITKDLLVFSCCPEASPYVRRISINLFSLYWACFIE